MCFVWPSQYLIKKLPVLTKRAIIILIKVKLCNASLRMLLLCIRSCLQSVLRYKFLILVPIIRKLYLREQGCEDPWLFLKPKRVREQKRLKNTAVYYTHLDKSSHRLSQPIALEQEPIRTTILLIHMIQFKFVTEGISILPTSLKLCMKTENLMPIK
jgi:hypothetical protein